MTSTTPVDEIVEAMEVDSAEAVESNPPRYNIAPTQEVLVVTHLGKQRSLAPMRWGLVPFFSKSASGAAKMINARAEAVVDKPAYRRAFRKRRCLVPIDGFYEWQTVAESKRKQPWYFTSSDGSLMALAGLWESWHDPEAPEDVAPLRSFTIITTAANEDADQVHHRMPLVLPQEQWSEWLGTSGTDVDQTASLLEVPAPGALHLRPVSTLVNSVANDGPELIDRTDLVLNPESDPNAKGSGTLF